MKKKKLYLIALLGLLFNSVELLSSNRGFGQRGIPFGFDRTKYSELAKFVDRYHCPESLQANHKDHFDKGGDIDRIINAERLRVVISKFNLDCLAVAEKYLYKGADGTYRVLSKRVPSDLETFDSCSLTVKEFQQLVKMIQVTGCSDLHQYNIVRDSNAGLITFIDTEDNSFSFCCNNPIDFRWIDGGGFWKILSAMCEGSVPGWIESFILDSFIPYKNNKTLSGDGQYDKEIGINFERVKAELRHMQGKPLRARL